MKPSDYKKMEQDLKKRKLPGQVKLAVQILLNRKAEKIIVMKLKEISQLTDFLVICQGNSARQNQALADHIRAGLKKEVGLRPFSSEGEQAAEWILVDYVDFVVNIFLPEVRVKYSLEKLWMDAKRYDFYVAGESKR